MSDNFQMYVTKLLLALAMLVLAFKGRSQINDFHTKYKIVSVGENVPDLIMSTHPYKTLTHFTGKLLIVDFWATWCGSCVAMFPRLEQIKRELKGELDILLVTDESEKTVKAFNIRRVKLGKSPVALSGIYNDTILKKLFPHELLPHYVWIDDNGVVRAITAAAEISVANIKAIINQKSTDLPVKNDEQKEIFHDPLKPLFIKGNGGDGSNIIWHSVLSGEVKGLQNVGVILLNKNYGFVQAANNDIYSLYKNAFGDDSDYHDLSLPNSRIKFLVNDSDSYFARFDAGKHISGQLYCYNLLTPPLNAQELKHWMQTDLEKYFRLKTKWEKHIVPCLVLTADDSSLFQPVREEMLNTDGHSTSDYHFISLNNSFSFFRRQLTESFLFYSPYPIINETGYSGLAYFKIEADMHDWRSIDKALSKYKIHLNLVERETNILIVSPEN